MAFSGSLWLSICTLSLAIPSPVLTSPLQKWLRVSCQVPWSVFGSQWSLSRLYGPSTVVQCTIWDPAVLTWPRKSTESCIALKDASKTVDRAALISFVVWHPRPLSNDFRWAWARCRWCPRKVSGTSWPWFGLELLIEISLSYRWAVYVFCC